MSASPVPSEGALSPWLYPEGLSFARFRLQLKVVERARFPADKGRMLRHGLIHSLRNHPCVAQGEYGEPGPGARGVGASVQGEARVAAPGAGGCPLHSLPLAFVLSPPTDERTWYYTAENQTGHLVVAGTAAAHMRCMIRALDHHIRLELPTLGYSKALLEQVDLLDPRDQQHTSFYFTKERKLKTAVVPYTLAQLQKRAALLFGRPRITLRFATPLRSSHMLGDDSAAWLGLFAERFTALEQAQALLAPGAISTSPSPSRTHAWPEQDALARLQVDTSALTWTERSTRVFEAQGEVRLHGDLDRLFVALVAGQHLHLGQGAAVGFGRYELKP